MSLATPERLNSTAIDFPPEVDELDMSGLRTPAAHVSVPLIAESPVSLECRLFQIVELGPLRSLFIGEVLAIHVADRAVVDISIGMTGPRPRTLAPRRCRAVG